MIDSNPSAWMLLAIVPLMMWRLYARFRRMVGRQRLSKGRLGFALSIYAALLFYLGFSTHSYPERIAWLAGGIVLGSALGAYGLSKTRFEKTREGSFYTPHVRIGIAVALLFVGRFAYRIMELHAAGGHGRDDFARNTSTLGIFGFLAGYYITYSIGLLSWKGDMAESLGEGNALGSKEIGV